MGNSWSVFVSRATGGVTGNRIDHRPTTLEMGLTLPMWPEWMNDALCAQTDPEAFFPEKGGSTKQVKKLCLTCDVRSECLRYALDHDERYGVWGGLSERERRALKKAEKVEQNAPVA